MVVVQGQTRGGEDGIHCRIIVHMALDGDVARLPEVLVGSQHMSMAFGHWSDALAETGRLLGMELAGL